MLQDQVLVMLLVFISCLILLPCVNSCLLDSISWSHNIPLFRKNASIS